MLLELDILWLTVQTGVVFTTSLIHVIYVYNAVPGTFPILALQMCSERDYNVVMHAEVHSNSRRNLMYVTMIASPSLKVEGRWLLH